MLTSFSRGVKKCLGQRFSGEFLLLSGILAALIIVFFSVVVAADDGRPANALGGYTVDGKVTWVLPGDSRITSDLKGLTPSQMEARFPMSAGAEAAIIHQALARPVIIDSVLYPGNQLSLFNGKRLYYAVGGNNALYAFTSAAGLEQYQATKMVSPSPKYPGAASLFFKDWLYTGDKIILSTGAGYNNLSAIVFDRVISSAEVSVTAAWAYLYDSNYFQGNCLAIPGGADLPDLSFYGWNDRASSVRTQ